MTTYNGGGIAIGPDGNLAGFTYDSDANTWVSTCAISSVGNVTTPYIIADGSLLTNVPGNDYGNANVGAYLTTYTGNISADNISMSGDITAAGVGTGNITVAGNVTAANFYGNGSTLTGVSNYSNANVASYMSTFSGNISGNIITASSFVGSGATLSNIAGANVTGAVSLATFANTAGSANTAISASIANTATTATYANTANALTTTNFTITEVGGKLMFAYQGANIASLSSVGVFTTANNVTGFGTP